MIIPDFESREREGLRWFVCAPLERAGFKNAFSTRLGGVSPLPNDALSLGNFRQDEGANVVENRRRFLRALDAVDWTLVTARQVHSADVRVVVDLDDARSQPVTCDALSADIPRTLLAVQTADCVPVLVADERTGAFAAIHAGWRGTLARIVARTVERMQYTYDSRPKDLRVALGPAIGKCCLEMGPEVIENFSREFSYAEEHISRRRENGKAHLDLNRMNARQLIDCGVDADRIHDTDLCTFCQDDLFFSYRRENGAERPVGRLMGVIGRTT
jgi:purine-nucleoside/S-methyl-5'-thioadenosine phosphorylase / adenosine deaminase